jgi:hypothetical protein
MNKGLLLGGLALAAGAALFASGKANAAPSGTPLTPSGPVDVNPGDEYELVFATSRPITTSELASIQQSYAQGMQGIGEVRNVRFNAASNALIAEVAYIAHSTLQIGAVGAIGSNPGDQIIIQLISFKKVTS